MAAEISREHQAELDLHRIMLEAMRAREAEILRFVAFLLPAIGGVFALLFIRSPNTPAPLDTIFLIAPLTVIILLFFGGWYTLALSYNYRYTHLVLMRLQNNLSLHRFQPRKWGQSWAHQSTLSDRALFGFAPEIFRTQVLFFFFLIFFVAAVFLPLNAKLGQSLSALAIVGLFDFIALVLLLWLGLFFYPRKYDELCEER